MRIRITLFALISLTLTLALPAIAQTPFAQLPDPTKDALINDTFKFCVTFQNTGTAPGYAPFIDLVFPRDPMNLNSPCDGISFVSATVTSTTPPVPLTPEPFVPGGCTSTVTNITHPFSPQVTSPASLGAGMQLVTLALPFGSFQPLQPKMLIEVTAKVDHYADVNAPIIIYARGGFRYGSNAGPGPAIVQAATNPPIGWQTETITPRVVILHNTYSGDEQETVPGPNFPQSFTVTADIAPGQVLNGLTLQDCLLSGGVWSGAPTINPTPTNWGNAGSCFAVNYASITGSGAGTIVVTRPSTIDNSLLGSTSCLKPITNSAIISNGTWQPADPLDPLVQLWGTPQSPSPADTVIQVKALATQKKPQPGPTTPGSTITYDIPFQISDYQRFGNLVITDTMSDGLNCPLGTCVSASLTVTDKVLGTTTIPSFPAGFITGPAAVVNSTFNCPPLSGSSCAPPGPIGSGMVTLQGGTRYVFNISGALQSVGHSGVLTGGCFPSSGLCGVGAHGTLTIKVNVLDAFLYGNHGGMDNKVDKDDPLLNHADISGRVPGKFGITCGDDGNSCLAVPSDILHKEVVAVNNVYGGPWTLGGPNVKVNDTVTFRLSKKIPSGDAESMAIQDWYPLPVIQALPLSSVPLCVPSAQPTLPPAPGAACYSFFSPLQPQPPIFPAADNSLTFNFQTFNDPTNQPRDLAIYTTHTISNQPFADGLLLTNEAQECEKNSYGVQFCQAAIAQFTLQEPFLRIHKGVCGGSCQGGNTQSICASCPNVTFFNSTSVANYLGSPMVYADAGDTVQFAIAVENTGSGPNGAFDVQISDTLGTFPGAISYNSFCIKRGDGTPVNWAFVSNTPTSFTLKLTSPNTNGSPTLGSSPSPSGANVILIMYSVTLNGNLTNGCYSNKGHIAHYANMPNGPDFVSAGYAGPDASATVCIMPHDLQKSLLWTSELDPVSPNVTIGELVQYQLSVIVPEGSSTFTMLDTLPPGLQMVSGPATIVPGTAEVTGVGFNPGITTVNNTGSLTAPQFAFNNLVNPNHNPACERLNVHFYAQVMNNNLTFNNNLVPKTNTFSIGSQTSNPVTVTIVEPKLSVQKNVIYGQTGVGYAAQYSITITNISSATAFDVTIQESLPACVSMPTNPVLKPPVPLGVTLSGTFTNGFLLNRLTPGQSATLTFQVSVTPKCPDCASLTNNVRVQWTSEPGLQGTLSMTPGGSCAVNGERCGNGNPHNNYFAVATASICGKVCGVKFADLNGDGIQNVNEPPLAGWTVNAGSVTATTDASGKYCLDLVPHLPPGPYTVCEGTLPNWTPTTPSCVQAPVVANTTTNVNFGNRPLCSATLCGKKTTPPPNSQPVGGWTITATGNGPVVTAITKPDGTYCMTLFGFSGYTISEALQTGWAQILPASGSYNNVKVNCVGGVPIITGVPDPNHVDFVNKNVCANVNCPTFPNLQQCVVGPNNNPTCVDVNINNTN